MIGALIIFITLMTWGIALGAFDNAPMWDNFGKTWDILFYPEYKPEFVEDWHYGVEYAEIEVFAGMRLPETYLSTAALPVRFLGGNEYSTSTAANIRYRGPLDLPSDFFDIEEKC